MASFIWLKRRVSRSSAGSECAHRAHLTELGSPTFLQAIHVQSAVSPAQSRTWRVTDVTNAPFYHIGDVLHRLPDERAWSGAWLP